MLISNVFLIVGVQEFDFASDKSFTPVFGYEGSDYDV